MDKSNYPPIGSVWENIIEGYEGETFIITGHDMTSSGAYSSGRIQFEYITTKRISCKRGTKDSTLASFFRTSYVPCIKTYSCAVPTSKINNDGRETCFSCGAPTKIIGCMPASDMKVCTKCGK